MRILKPGAPQFTPKKIDHTQDMFFGTCQSCGLMLEAMRSECQKVGRFMRKRYVLRCPTKNCGTDIEMLIQL